MIPLHPVFNDHSNEPLADNAHAARKRLSDFVQTVAIAPDRGLGRLLRIPEMFYATNVGEGYTISTWLGDSAVAREETAFLLQIATLAPFLKDAPAPVLAAESSFEVRFEGEDSGSFRAARLLDVPLISLNHAQWGKRFLNAAQLNLTSSGEIVEESVTLVNVADATGYDFHAEWIAERRARQIDSMAVLWREREQLLPHLEFCPNVEAQILAVGAEEDSYALIIARLFEMERQAGAQAGDFNPDGFKTKCHSSGKTTLQKYASAYTFTRVNGVKVACGWHFYLPDGRRLYFVPAGGNFIVGHIGKHLPTKLFPS